MTTVHQAGTASSTRGVQAAAGQSGGIASRDPGCLQDGNLLVATCSTSAFILEELTGEKVQPHCYASAWWPTACSPRPPRTTARRLASSPRRAVNLPVLEYLDKFDVGDAVIKGGNAVDPYGNAACSPVRPGGTVGASSASSRCAASPSSCPSAGEAHPDVVEASNGWASARSTGAWGEGVAGAVTSGLVVTENRSARHPSRVDAKQVAAGGIGHEGASCCSSKAPRNSWTSLEDLESVKGEAPSRCRATATPVRGPL